MGAGGRDVLSRAVSGAGAAVRGGKSDGQTSGKMDKRLELN